MGSRVLSGERVWNKGRKKFCIYGLREKGGNLSSAFPSRLMPYSNNCDNLIEDGKCLTTISEIIIVTSVNTHSLHYLKLHVYFDLFCLLSMVSEASV